MNFIDAVILLALSAWLLARALPAQNIALIIAVLILCEGALETILHGGSRPRNGVLFWPAIIILTRVGARWVLRLWRKDWKYGFWLILLTGVAMTLAQFAIALAGSTWAVAAKLAAIRFGVTAVCLFFLSPWFISKFPQQPQDHTQ